MGIKPAFIPNPIKNRIKSRKLEWLEKYSLRASKLICPVALSTIKKLIKIKNIPTCICIR
jgi:hypothetical protein